MKKALVDYIGYVKEIVEPGEDFEIYSGDGCTMQWVDAPDDIQTFWTLEYSAAADKMIWIERDLPYHDPILRRKIAYGESEVQLGMLYDDIASGNIENGKWVTHIKNVKASIPKPPASAYDEKQDPNQTFDLKKLEDGEQEPSVDRQMHFSTMDLPAWVRYEGWGGPNTIV
jgi:hypothetical protein